MKYTKLFLLVVLFLASCAAPATSAPVPTQTFTPEPTATQTPIPTPTMTPAPTQVGGGSGRLIFTYRKEEFIKAFPDLKGEINVFVANIDGTKLTPITNGLKGYNYFESVSPDGTKVLIASRSKLQPDAILYLVNLNSLDSEPIKLTDGLPQYYGGNSTAKWIDDSQIVYIGQGEAGFGIYKINVDGTNPINIYKYNNDGEGNKPFQILAIDSTHIYWDTQITTRLNSNSVNDKYYVWWSSLEGSERSPLELNGKQIFFETVLGSGLIFSPDGTKVAWIEGATPESGPPYHNYLHIASISDINNPYTLETLTSEIFLNWWPDGSKILVFDIGAVWGTRGTTEDPTNDLYGIYEVSVAPDLPIKNYHLATVVMGLRNSYFMDLYNISPDGRLMVCATYEKNASGSFDSKLKFLNLETITFADANGFTFSNTANGGVHWIP